MKGLYVNNRLGERDQQIIAALMDEHEVHLHRSLWTAEQVLAEQGMFEFMITNMPMDKMSRRMMSIYSHLPKEEYYGILYSTSFACLDMLHENWPAMQVIVYTGADKEPCSMAVSEHRAAHLIRRGRYELEFEIDEIRKVLAGEEFTPLWQGNTLAKRAKRIAFIDSCAVDKGWKPGTYGRTRHSANREIISALEMRLHSIRAYDDLWADAKRIVENDNDEYGPFDFIITNLPHDPPPHPKMPAVRGARQQGGTLQEQMEMYSQAMDRYWKRSYGRSMHSLEFLRQHLPDAKVILYTGAPREICDKCESEYGLYHVTLRGRPLRGFPMCRNLQGIDIEKKDILEVVKGTGK